MEDNQVFIFKRICNYEGQPKTTNVIETDAVLLPELLTIFEQFIKGCGFYMGEKEHLELINDEEETEE